MIPDCGAASPDWPAPAPRRGQPVTTTSTVATPFHS